MKTKGRPTSKNIEDRRKKKSAFTKAGRANYAASYDKILTRVAAKKKYKKMTRTSRTNGR